MYKLHLLLFVITTDNVFVNPTVIVPKSSFSGLISIKPSLPAPMMVIDLLLVGAYNPDLFSDVNVSPDPGAKKPIVFLT